MTLDQRREVYRAKLHPLYLPIYDGLCADLPPSWQPYYGLRTAAQQDALYAQGRTLPGSPVTQAQAWESAHNFGCASDWTYWLSDQIPVWLSPKDPRWADFAQIVEKVGGDWGGEFPHPDCPHVQLGLTVGWKTLRPIVLDQGQEAVDQYIRTHLRTR